ncbi:Protein CBG10173 [Caenorhabditis briggsae]|uniref:Protein CBG10173 n=1 Tax=Caenorhabditis briggsae TaxID=6238 RepID=A8XAW5_CAEBR|nr:Protein CBG10173 [Caenorhabditis briggsae]CAP29780.2 Protein CBG10173 [Caenorhabditis briggsae]
MATKYAYPMQSLLKTMSLCIGLAMTVERWVAVCKPLEALVRCTQKVSIRMLKIIVICSVFFNSPKFFELEPGILSATGNLWYFFLYHVLMSLLFDYMVPFVVMARLNYQSILELRESQQRAESLTTSKIDYGKAIRMLWVVTLFFAACHVFGAALRIAESFVDQKNELFKLAAEVSQMCILFYSSALFFIYWYFSSFYQERLRLLFKQKPGNYFEEKWVNLFRRSGTTAANFYIELDEKSGHCRRLIVVAFIRIVRIVFELVSKIVFRAFERIICKIWSFKSLRPQLLQDLQDCLQDTVQDRLQCFQRNSL